VLWPDSIVVDGDAIALADVVADVTIHHGRADVSDDPTASTCQLTIRDVDRAFVQAFRVGVPLVITARDGIAAPAPRFTGTVTDARLDVDDLTAIAAGRLSTLGRYPVGAVAWPAEPWSARVSRIFAEAGLAAQLELVRDPDFDPQLVARDPLTAGETTLGDYLTFLAPMVGAAVTDRMSGTILVQAIGARSLAAAAPLAPADVSYAPAWEQVLPPGNVVTVRYLGDQSASVEVRDAASVAFYGERPRTIDTTFASVADATTRANEALARGAYAHWNIPQTPILRGLQLAIGQPVTLSAMPPSSPFQPWTPIVEGWEDTIAGDEWTMLLALSDPLASGVLLPWSTVPASYLWNTIDAVVPWRDALTLDALVPG
jgi:hypothetical protein